MQQLQSSRARHRGPDAATPEQHDSGQLDPGALLFGPTHQNDAAEAWTDDVGRMHRTQGALAITRQQHDPSIPTWHHPQDVEMSAQLPPKRGTSRRAISRAATSGSGSGLGSQQQPESTAHPARSGSSDAAAGSAAQAGQTNFLSRLGSFVLHRAGLFRPMSRGGPGSKGAGSNSTTSAAAEVYKVPTASDRRFTCCSSVEHSTIVQCDVSSQ
jgi:hypothetical protein